jgi:hypothetical protein
MSASTTSGCRPPCRSRRRGPRNSPAHRVSSRILRRAPPNGRPCRRYSWLAPAPISIEPMTTNTTLMIVSLFWTSQLRACERSNHSVPIHHERRDRHDHCKTGDHGVAQGEADSRCPRQPCFTDGESGADCEGELLRIRDRQQEAQSRRPGRRHVFHRRHPHGQRDIFGRRS